VQLQEKSVHVYAVDKKPGGYAKTLQVYKAKKRKRKNTLREEYKLIQKPFLLCLPPSEIVKHC
jgi:hypothetical protein